jgi:hypothetical protein
MKIYTEFHETQKTLFRRVNQIRKADGLCSFEEDGAGYRLRYCEGIDKHNAYVVLKGKDNMLFRLYHGQEACAVDFNEGDLLIYEYEDNNKVWFSSPALAASDDMDMEDPVAYADYGSLADMVQAGLIADARYRDMVLPAILRDVIKKSSEVETLEPQKQPVSYVQPELTVQKPAIFNLLPKLLENSDIKIALNKALNIAEYSDKKTGDYIGTHQVMYRSYYSDYCFMKASTYRQAAQLRFGGRWMERAGFEYKTMVKVITMKDMIVIVPIQPLLAECAQCQDMQTGSLKQSFLRANKMFSESKNKSTHYHATSKEL